MAGVSYVNVTYKTFSTVWFVLANTYHILAVISKNPNVFIHWQNYIMLSQSLLQMNSFIQFKDFFFLAVPVTIVHSVSTSLLWVGFCSMQPGRGPALCSSACTAERWPSPLMSLAACIYCTSNSLIPSLAGYPHSDGQTSTRFIDSGVFPRPLLVYDFRLLSVWILWRVADWESVTGILVGWRCVG